MRGRFSLTTPARLWWPLQMNCLLEPAAIWSPASSDYLVTWYKDAAGGRSAFFPSCEHLQERRSGREGETRFECGLFGELLEETELEQICVNFQPGRDSPMKRAFRGQE